MTTHDRWQSGFTLVEMAIVLFVVALLLGGGLGVFRAQVEQQRFSDTRKTLMDARQALIGFAASVTPPYLPCPDRTAGAGANDGVEDRAGPACVVAEGNLPWITLGIPGTDAWGNRLRYRVTPAFTNSATGIQLTSVGTLSVNNELGIAVAVNVPVIILSHGQNAWGATSGGGAVIALPPATNLNERENTDGDNLFVDSKPTTAAAVAGEYDDILTWLPGSILFSRMLEAGKL